MDNSMIDHQQVPPDIAASRDQKRKCYTPQQEAIFELVIAVELLLMGFMAGRFTTFIGV